MHPTVHAHCSEAAQRWRRQGDELSQVRDQLRSQQFHLRAIGNMDETPIFFDMPGNRTVDLKGTSTVSIKTSDTEMCFSCYLLSFVL